MSWRSVVLVIAMLAVPATRVSATTRMRARDRAGHSGPWSRVRVRLP